MEKRYAIVRVDNKCPEYTEEDFECPFSNDKIECEICRQGRYGDTKKQLIRKVAQVIYKEKIEWYKKRIMVNTISKLYCMNAYDSALQVAVKIVEFLGVEE